MHCPFCKTKYNFTPGKVAIMALIFICNECGAILQFQPAIQLYDTGEIQELARQIGNLDGVTDFLSLVGPKTQV